MGRGIVIKDEYGNWIDLTDPEQRATLDMPAARNPLLITKDEAVGRCGITADQFDALVAEGIFPDRHPGTHVWNRKKLNRVLEMRKLFTRKVEPGWVYFMEMGDFIKIGWSTWPATRRDELQIGNPYDIVILGAVPGAMENEAELHAVFARAKHRGEWFRKTPGLLAYIAWLKVAWRGDSRVIRGERDNVVKLAPRGEIAGNEPTTISSPKKSGGNQ